MDNTKNINDGIREMIPCMLSIKEASLRTGVSQSFVRRLCKDNKIVYVKSGKKYLINYNKFIDFLNAGN